MPASFLALPLELRILIYEELLFAKPNNNDGRRTSFHWIPTDLRELDTSISSRTAVPFRQERVWSTTNGIETAILRINKQIHHEAVPTLYEHIDCKIITCHEKGYLYKMFESRQADGTTDRNDFNHAFSAGFETLCKTHGASRAQYEQSSTQDSRSISAPMTARNMMNLGCLSLGRNISIRFSWFEIFGVLRCSCDVGTDNYTPGQHRFSRVGQLMVQILRYLNDEISETETKARTLHLQSDDGDLLDHFVNGLGLWRTSAQSESQALEPRLKDLRIGLTEIFGLLKSLNGRFSITMTERVTEYWPEAQRVDWERFPWSED